MDALPLDARLDAAALGGARVAVLIGPARSGKTTALAAAAQRWRARGARVVWWDACTAGLRPPLMDVYDNGVTRSGAAAEVIAIADDVHEALAAAKGGVRELRDHLRPDRLPARLRVVLCATVASPRTPAATALLRGLRTLGGVVVAADAAADAAAADDAAAAAARPAAGGRDARGWRRRTVATWLSAYAHGAAADSVAARMADALA